MSNAETASATIFNPVTHHSVSPVNKPIIPYFLGIWGAPVRIACRHRDGCANQVSHLSGDATVCYIGWRRICDHHSWDPQLCWELNVTLDQLGVSEGRYSLDLRDLMDIFPHIRPAVWRSCKCVSPTRKLYVRSQQPNDQDNEDEYVYDDFCVPDDCSDGDGDADSEGESDSDAQTTS